MNRLVLVRHAEPEAAVRGPAYGDVDPGLSPEGQEQAAAIAEALRTVPLEAVFSSPLRRALETARPLARTCGLEPVVVDALRELDFGEVAGLPFEEIERTRPELYRDWMNAPTSTRFPGGEELRDLRERVLPAAAAIRAEVTCAALVAHGGVIRVILAEALRMAPEAIFGLDQPYGAVSVVDWLDGMPIVRCMSASLESAAWLEPPS